MRFSLVIAGCLLGVSLNGQGIQDSLFTIEQVDITATRNFVKEEAGMKESPVDTLVLQEQVHLNLSDILSENTSIYIKDYGRGAMSTASFRGTAPSHTILNWNGISINSPMLGMVDFSLIPVFIVDDLSLLHSGASVSQQSGGLGGMVQISNGPDWQNRFSGRFYQAFGSFSTYKEFAQLNFGGKTFQSKTRIYLEHSDNDYEFVNKKILERDSISGALFHPVQKNSNADYGKKGIMQEIYIRASDNTFVNGQFWYQDADRSIPTVLSSELHEGSGQRENSQSDNSFRSVVSIDHYREYITVRYFSAYDHQALDYVMKSSVSGLGSLKPVNSGSKMNSQLNKLQLSFEPGDRLSMQASATFDWRKITTLDSADMTGYSVNRKESSVFAGVYYSPFRKVQASIQLRKDWIEDASTPLIYTIGFNLKPMDSQSLVIKGNIVRNYKHPSLNDLYWQPGGNPDLLPEEGYTGELSLQYEYADHGITANTTLTAYYSDINNWIMWTPTLRGFWQPANLASVTSYGMEYHFNSNYSYKKTRVALNGNIALTRTIQNTDQTNVTSMSEAQLPYLPRVTANLFVSLRNRGYYINYQQNTIGKRTLLRNDLDDTGLDNGLNSLYTLYPHYLNKLSVGKEIKTDFALISLELKIENLLNETYRNILQRFMPGRTYICMLKLDF